MQKYWCENGYVKVRTKFKVDSITRFVDMFQLSEYAAINKGHATRYRSRPFSGFLFVRFSEIIHMNPCAKVQVYGFTCVGYMFEGVSNFIRVT